MAPRKTKNSERAKHRQQSPDPAEIDTIIEQHKQAENNTESMTQQKGTTTRQKPERDSRINTFLEEESEEERWPANSSPKIRERTTEADIFQSNLKKHERTTPALYKWNLKFNGSTPVLEFIDTIEDRVQARGLTEKELLQGFSDLLEDSSLQWFRSIRTHVTSWKTLKGALINKYEQLNYRTRLENDLRNTKQLEGETMSDYLTRLDTMNNRLSPRLKDSTILEIVKLNILPLYYTLLGTTKLTDIGNLLDLAKNFEQYAFGPKPANVSNPRQHAPATVRNKPTMATINNHELVQDGAYEPKDTQLAAFPQTSTPHHQFNRGHPHNYSQGAARPAYHGQRYSQRPNQFSQDQRQLKCQKCERQGHNYRDCMQYPNPICFTCKTPGQYTNSCRKCNSSHPPRHYDQSKNGWGHGNSR